MAALENPLGEEGEGGNHPVEAGRGGCLYLLVLLGRLVEEEGIALLRGGG